MAPWVTFNSSGAHAIAELFEGFCHDILLAVLSFGSRSPAVRDARHRASPQLESSSRRSDRLQPCSRDQQNRHPTRIKRIENPVWSTSVPRAELSHMRVARASNPRGVGMPKCWSDRFQQSNVVTDALLLRFGVPLPPDPERVRIFDLRHGLLSGSGQRHIS